MMLSSTSAPLALPSLLRAIPGLHLFLSPELIILEATDAYLEATLKDSSIIGKYLFDVFPDNPAVPGLNSELNLKQSLHYALTHKVEHTMALQRYDVTRPQEMGGGFEEKYWQPSNKPVLNAAGEVQYLIHSVVDVTEAHKYKQEQEITKGSIRAFVEASGGSSWDYDIASGKFYWGKNFEQVFGHKVSEDGESPAQWDARVHPSEYDGLRESISEAVKKQEKVWSGKYRFLKGDGTYTHVMDHGYILYNDEGKPYRMLGTLIDIERQQENERLAKENLERFELLAKATNDVIWDWDLTNDFIWWNDGFKVTFGYKQEDIEHDINSWYGRLHPEDAARVVEGIHHVIDNGGTNWQDEYQFRKADGTYAHVFDRGLVARNEAGKPIRMIGAMLDLTEKNKYAAELKEREQHVRALLEGIPEIAWVARADGYIHYYNKAWYEYTGNTSPDEGWDHIVHPEDLKFTIDRWSQSLKTGQEYVNEARLRRASDGRYHWFTIRATPLINEDGTINSWIGVDTNIQDQKDIQSKLKERDEYVQRMLSQSPVQFAVLKGPDWIVDFVTPQFKQLIGGRETVGKPFRQALPELETQGFFDIVEKVYATKELYLGTETPAYLDRNGNGELELGYFNFMYQPLLDAEGAVEGIIIVVVEVTERVRVREKAQKLAEELKVSHERTLKILDALPHMTFTAKPDGFVEYYSQQWYDYLGTTQEELNGWGWEYFIHPDDLAKTHAGWSHSLKTGEPFMVENRWRTKAKEEYRWFLVRGVPMRDEEGNITLWVGSHTDIQDQKQMLLDLQESTQNFQFLADSMPQLVWTTDAVGYHEYFNKQWVEFTGFDVEASKGPKVWNDLLHPDDRQRSFARWHYSLRTGEPYQVEYRFRRAADGEWRWFLGRALPLRDQEGNIVKWFGTCTEIEDQKRNEELMEQTNRELRSINEDLDSFVYTASHDLKLPIINMAGIFQELTQNATFHDPDAQLLISMFNKSLKQINATISDLAEIVKVQKEIDAHQEEIKLSELVDEVQLSIQDLIQKAGAHITCDFAEADTLLYSRVNLKSIFYNLISNAVKYRSPDRAPVVRLHTQSNVNGYTVLTVQDNGMGMDMEKHGAKMFQMFKRFHNHVEGSGLGLYILNRIVQKNGGRIEVDSQVDQGTTFTIYFRNSVQ
ncbi:PAS domain-containing protein [Rufibacter roseolus]|uniref:PAS domain-containing protein n=1 Tax=Rufibacter roseolus TaxID=2817375 RepID=UPI001B30C7B5|nr:PAS domain-containing protein [Rufibacter roseolus]